MSNIIFSIQTLQTDGGGSLKSVKPSADGVYCDVPVAVIGLPSRNRAVYDLETTLAAMSDPSSRFYKNLAEGNLEGEWGHPKLPPVLTKEDKIAAIMRTLTIDRECVSHYFTKIRTQKASNGSHVVVFADVVPFGPYGKYLQESFADAKRNTCFSLRSLTSDPTPLPNGCALKKMKMLVTFDAVDGPGFEMASKRYMPGTESYAIADEQLLTASVSEIIQFPSFAKAVGYESIDSPELLDMLQTDKICIKKEFILEGIFDPDKKVIVTAKGQQSLFHTLFK
jgi:hypothetical protein